MKMWSGRFNKDTDKGADEFNSSISFDSRLYRHDIEGSIAHSRMLGKIGILTEEETLAITRALQEIMDSIENGTLYIQPDAEDIHMFIEKVLTDKIGETGKKLHTARSRNDQIALDIRMYLRDECDEILNMIRSLAFVIIDTARRNLGTIMPGFTHMQPAQPVTLAHHLMAYFEMFKRDMLRIKDCLGRMNSMPLGACALAGTGFPIDREYTAGLLGFGSVTENSIDSVSDRDFIIELCSAFSILMMHLSRFCEELIIWNTQQFSFVEQDDAFSTGSSIMPQKKNPDIAELVRGKTGRVYGNLFAILTVMKSLPLAYNKDMQEDKPAVFDSIDTVKMCLPVFRDMFASLSFNKDAMLESAGKGFTNATDLADYLVLKGLSFRTAHEITGKAVSYCIGAGKSLCELSIDEFKLFSVYFENDIHGFISLESCVDRRRTQGGPSGSSVESHIVKALDFLKSH
ncbi:MAG: argininosuccinate lyase [Clostridia bacterium]|nr:argininosuccinate lyase [Clostridia bacterium]